MLSPSEAAVVARDRALPGLAALLDDRPLAELTGMRVRRRYLRYKPGTSCVLGGSVALAGEDVDAFVLAHDARSAEKIGKTVDAAPPGTVLFTNPELGLLMALAPADRDLPFLAALADARRLRRTLRRLLPSVGWRGVQLRTLSYKPQRRWVGLATARDGQRVVLRAYPPADAARAAGAVRALGKLPPGTPRLLGADVELGLVALEYAEGQTLDTARADASFSGAAAAGRLRAAGVALAQLHTRVDAGVPSWTAADDAQALRSVADQVAVLLPELGPPAAALADLLAQRMSGLPPDTVCAHGDFSTDQVVLGADGSVVLLDLDRVAQADAAIDLASLAASLTAADLLAGRRPEGHVEFLSAIGAGYAAVRPLPDAEALRLHTAALLLRRSTEPFRLCAPLWPERMRAMLAAATAAAENGDPLTQALDDVVGPLLGEPLRWELLKDKPGRRRTSRATGSRGSAIVKVYASGRAPVVAARVAALRSGPAEPVVPRVMLCEDARHVVVLSEVPGRPFREALLAGDTDAAARVGHALATWHGAFRGCRPEGLRAHTVTREVEILLERSAGAPPAVADAVRTLLPLLQCPWRADTVVHRDLYEEQIVVGTAIGLLDLDDVAGGPAELDLGNLMAHLDLLSKRTGRQLGAPVAAMLSAYRQVGPLDEALLEQCRLLSLLRLACLHAEPALVPQLPTSPSSAGHCARPVHSSVVIA